MMLAAVVVDDQHNKYSIIIILYRSCRIHGLHNIYHCTGSLAAGGSRAFAQCDLRRGRGGCGRVAIDRR
jgi:hypothetical protein